jgi:hypothetical protein
LRQIVIALVAGQRLDQDDYPGEATLQVLHGRGAPDCRWLHT